MLITNISKIQEIVMNVRKFKPVKTFQSFGLQIMILVFMISLCMSSAQFTSPTNPNKKIFNLQNQETIDLSITTPIKIILSTNSGQGSDKAHLLQYSQHQGIITDQLNVHDWNITIYYQIIEGSASFYVGPCVGFFSGSLQTDMEQFNVDNVDRYIRQYLKMTEGTNVVSQVELKNYFDKQAQGSKIIHSQFCIFVLPSKPAKFVVKLGPPQYIVKSLKNQIPQQIVVNRGDTEKKILALKVQSDYNVRIQRKNGFPSIYLIQCPRRVACYQQKTIIPPSKSKTRQEEYVKQSIQSMLSKIEQFTGKVCFSCDLYLVLEARHSDKAEIQVALQPLNYVFQLKQNQILHEQIKAKGIKKYGLDVPKNEKVKINVQVYEGEIGILIREIKGEWQYQPKQNTGVISVQMPNQNSGHFNISIFALKEKDATYSIVYSSGQNQIYVRDGYPTSQVLRPGQNISLIYFNEEVRKSPIYVTFNVNNIQALDDLKLRVFYFQEQKSKQKKQFIYQKQKSKNPVQNQVVQPSQVGYYPNSFSEPVSFRPTSSIIKIPGQFPRIQLQFTYNSRQSIQLSITVNDEQIVFLPINHSLPIQVDKDSSVNLLLDNNQQGSIQLTIKKCDESSPNIAYALSPKNFMTGNYDYESLGDSQRIFKNSIRVKKGGGLYIHIEGDRFSNSYLFITAKYAQKSKSQSQSGLIKKGNHGQINYQLITNSKVQIWFKQLECSPEVEDQCKKQINYWYFWSNNKGDLFREMICPALYLFDQQDKNINGHSILKQGYKIQTKPGADGIISLKHPLNDSIIYIGIKAVNQKTGEEFIYKDIQVVTISGQLQRMQTSYLFISLGTSIALTFLIVAFIRRQARLGYTPVNTAEGQKKRKSKLDIVRGN